MNADKLAKAVVFWLEYEALCERERLFSEAALRAPVGEFLLASQDHRLLPEEPYPNSMQPTGRGRRASVDFCLSRRGGDEVWTHIIETKWVNGKRDLSQEIFDDLVRLEIVEKSDQSASFDRYLLIAGPTAEVASCVQKKTIARSGVRLFDSVLPWNNGTTHKADVWNATDARWDYWKDAAVGARCGELPLTMKIALLASHHASFGCWIWRVMRSRNRSTRPVAAHS